MDTLARVYEAHQGYWKPHLCPTCPYLKGTKTCMRHVWTHKLEGYEENIYYVQELESSRHITKDSPCLAPEMELVVKDVSVRQKPLTATERRALQTNVYQWMKMNVDKTFKAQSDEVEDVISALNLFKSGKIDLLLATHGEWIYHSRINTTRSDAFNRFSGVSLFTGGLTGYGKEKFRQELLELSCYHRSLAKAIGIAHGVHANLEKKKQENFIRNFMYVIHEFITQPKTGNAYNHWPYLNEYRETLLLIGFKGEELPNVSGVDYDYYQKQKEVRAFVVWAKQRFYELGLR